MYIPDIERTCIALKSRHEAAAEFGHWYVLVDNGHGRHLQEEYEEYGV